MTPPTPWPTAPCPECGRDVEIVHDYPHTRLDYHAAGPVRRGREPEDCGGSRDTLLYAVRRDMGLTQEQLAERLGMEPNHLARIERGERPHTRRMLATLALVWAAPGKAWLAAHPEFTRS